MCILLSSGFWLFCFIKESTFNLWCLLYFFIASLLVFSIRQLLFQNQKTVFNNNKITVEDLKFQKLNFKPLFKIIEDKNKTPIGLSLISKKPVCLDLKNRSQHLIVSGATGQGKTTLLKTLLNHSLKHKYPVIIIDPKGEKADILEVKERLKAYGREQDFCLFSLSFPKDSFTYNPLENGTSEQIKARLIDGLKFEHEYYKAQSFFMAWSCVICFREFK